MEAGTPTAVARYHDLLSSTTLANDSQEHLERLQQARGLYFGTRPVCTVLRPRFLKPGQYAFLRDRVKVLLPAFQTAYDRAMLDTNFRKQFHLLDWEDELLSIEPGFKNPSPTSRFDSFFVSERELKFTEFNSETPAGAGYSDALAELFYGLPVFQEFQRQYDVRSVPCKPGVLHTLLDAYAQWRGTRNDPPRIAILDWREVPTFSEFVLFYDYFHGMGIQARNVDPRDVTYTNGKLMCGDYHITLIYKRVLISELIERGGIEHPVVQAVRDGAVCMANTFRCKILFKKASFAVISDEANAELFTPEQNAAIQAHIPWTRVVEERKTTFEGRNIDLVSHISAHKDGFVLKPNDDYGGKGIVLGWTVDQPIWEQAVQQALERPYVVQQKVNLPYEPFAGYDGEKLQIIPRMLDTNPFVAFSEHMHGCLTRISTEALLNVTAGGGSTVPTFLIEER
jgi:uncharacterized circularly permuted ATP-grasp superfamily protein